MWNQVTIPADRTTGPFHTKSFKIEALASNTVYEVIVQARNQYGSSDDSKTLRFATPSESKRKMEMIEFQDVRVSISDVQVFEC